MIPEALGIGVAAYLAALLGARVRGRLEDSAYPSPEQADAELDALAAAYPGMARVEEYGRSTEGRRLRLLRIGAPGARSRLLVSGQIHAGEFVAGYVARAVARELLTSDDPSAKELRGEAQVVVAPLLNPDGAQRVWDVNGWTSFRGMRITANGADPNRNFPFAERKNATERKRSWNSARSKAGTAYYRGVRPLSEPECTALARLCATERFCAALNFHSFGGVVYYPSLEGVFDTGEDAAARAFAELARGFPSRQSQRAYRVLSEHPDTLEGQLDAFLLGAFGTASATIEVGRPTLSVLKPSRVLNPFWIFNPEQPELWAENDVAATVQTLAALVRVTNGEPGRARQPALAAQFA